MIPPVIVTHPLAQIHLTTIRSTDTPCGQFRWHLHRLAEILFMEATRGLGTETVRIQTPLTETEGVALARPIVLVPILRAGLGLQEAILPLVPEATVAHVGIARDEETALPVPYYAKLPAILPEADVFLLDPMLATGGSACSAVTQLKAAGATRITLICVVSCPPGLQAFADQHPDVPVVTAAVDEGLNERCYIVPGLGDAGDRCFGT
ncbi:uracil phosphoribosyltransferase [Prosthecobacter fusiformis]|uniref:Uracil phosphoribosyltransferase n=1 Tax=Prosthecobacter fusiformis TaxID=48464 RepID=A0A4R7RZC6_9BACT|nr:uracil phosphoribosyltransferase [Prosthecobacter fusiformis]TDU71221.1 uracil phosphoribosyltransferase [Prosthecobacter fusiformis]